MNFGNTCAYLCRAVLFLLTIYGIVLSYMILEGCLLLKARVKDEEDYHGVGLKRYEDLDGKCVDHNAYILDNYNGMEVVAKICGYVAPSMAAVFVIILAIECCKRDVAGGKCIPALMMLCAIVCQGLTFLLFDSDLFCKGGHIQKCALGDTGYRNLLACAVYAISFSIYCFAPGPEPFSRNSNEAGPAAAAPAAAPSGDGDFTKEMYEQRRKEKNIKAKDVRGRSHRESEKHRGDRGDRNGERGHKDEVEDSVYEKPGREYHDDYTEQSSYSNGRGRRSKSKGQRYNDYYEEPDGMDWSAYSPGERELYTEKKSRKSRHRRNSRSPSPRNDRRHSDRDYGREYYDERYDDSHYTDRDDMGLELAVYDQPSDALVSIEDDSRYESRTEPPRSSSRRHQSPSRHRNSYDDGDYRRRRDDHSYMT